MFSDRSQAFHHRGFLVLCAVCVVAFSGSAWLMIELGYHLFSFLRAFQVPCSIAVGIISFALIYFYAKRDFTDKVYPPDSWGPRFLDDSVGDEQTGVMYAKFAPKGESGPTVVYMVQEEVVRPHTDIPGAENEK